MSGSFLGSPRGPYLNEDGDWWVEVAQFPTYLEARRYVERHLSYDIPYDGTLIYRGKERALLCDEHVGEDVGPMCNATCSRYALTYHWEEHRKW